MEKSALSAAPGSGGPESIFETPNYKVVVARLSNGPEDQPAELRIRFVVLSKQYPVVVAHCGLEGEAISLALAAESTLHTAKEMVEKARANGYRSSANHAAGGPLFPPDLS